MVALKGSIVEVIKNDVVEREKREMVKIKVQTRKTLRSVVRKVCLLYR